MAFVSTTSLKRKDDSVEPISKKLCLKPMLGSDQPKTIVKKLWKPRKQLIFTQVYALNLSNTKQIHVGLDVAYGFRPTIYFTKYTHPKNSGVYVGGNTFEELMSEGNIKTINSYFSAANGDEFKFKKLAINDYLNAEFRQFYNQKSVIFSDGVVYENFYTDNLILQKSSWDNLVKVSDCIRSTMKDLLEKANSCKILYDYIFKKAHAACLEQINRHDIGNLESSIKTVFNNCVQEANLESDDNFYLQNDISDKIYNEVVTFCGEYIVKNLVLVFKFMGGTIPEAQTQ